MEDFDDRADKLEGDAADMERRSEELEGEIGKASSEWEAKKGDDSIPGAQAGDEDEDHSGGEEPGSAGQ